MVRRIGCKKYITRFGKDSFPFIKRFQEQKLFFLRDLCVERLTARLGAGHNGKAE